MTENGALERGRGFVRRQAWAEAYAELSAADRDLLTAEDAEWLALAAYLIGEDEESVGAWERAYRGWLAVDDPVRAARCTFWLGFPLLLRGEAARGGGWLARGGRLLDDLGRDCAERGLLLVPLAHRALMEGDGAAALESLARIEEIGGRFHDDDVLTFGRLGRGQALIVLGRVHEGMSLLDEAMVAVTAGEVSPITTGVVYCAALLACQSTFDVARAKEWTDALSRWCNSQQGLVPFRGECFVHRSEIMLLHGAWTEALTEARRACEWLEGRPAAGRAHYQAGELHRLRGDVVEADRAYRAASEWGREPQPGCALLRLAEGQLDVAEAMIRRVVECAPDRVARSRLLPAYVEIALAADDAEAARDGADELSAIAVERQAPVLEAAACDADGATLLAEGDARSAIARLRSGLLLWQQLGAPYEAARTRAAIARACRELGDEETAARELETARSSFEQLGAATDLVRVSRIEGEARDAIGAGLTARELEVLELVAGGRTNREIASLLTISDHTVRRHLQNVYRKLGVTSRTAATTFALTHQLLSAADVVQTDH